MTSDVQLYVWMYLPGESVPVVAGRLTVVDTAIKPVGSFVYGKSYLKNSSATPIDPVALPLRRGTTEFSTLLGYPGSVLDACPDRWGIKVIGRFLGEQHFPSGYLLLNDPGRAGCLAFSASSSEPPIELTGREFSLEQLLHAAESVEAGREVDSELLKALHPGTGGVRPKCNVVDEDGVWIAKFPSAEDANYISVPRLEHATMTLARACGINAAETRLQTVAGRDVCLVRRFDRIVDRGVITRLGYLSARTVFFDDPGFERFPISSYPRLARWLCRFGTKTDDGEELYRRMIFNCAVRNSDDHELNHGLVYHTSHGYILAPAFDIVPQLKPHRIHQHALVIGDTAAGTVENLLSACNAFGLRKEAAVEIISSVTQSIRKVWQDIFYECGFGDEEIRRVDRYFQPIPLTIER